MLEEPSATKSLNQSLIQNTRIFYACLSIQRKESCANGFLASTFIPILRGLLRYVYTLHGSLPCTVVLNCRSGRSCGYAANFYIVVKCSRSYRPQFRTMLFSYELSFLPIVWLILIGRNNQNFGPNGRETGSCYWKLHRWKFGSIING
jgi:hypothetical protein